MGNMCNVANKQRGAKICKGWMVLETIILNTDTRQR